MCLTRWNRIIEQADRARGILARGGLPGEAWPTAGGAVVHLPAGTRAMDVVKLLVCFPGATYDHVNLTINLPTGD